MSNNADIITQKSDIVEKLNALTNYDPAIAHAQADTLLVEALRVLGANDVADAYCAAQDRIGFFCSEWGD